MASRYQRQMFSPLQVPWGSASVDAFIFLRKSVDNSSVALEAMWLGHMILLGAKTCRKLVFWCQTLHLASPSVSFRPGLVKTEKWKKRHQEEDMP